MGRDGHFGVTTKSYNSGVSDTNSDVTPTKPYSTASVRSSPSISTSKVSKTPLLRTPGKKLFKRLFCGPSGKEKDSVYSGTSLEGPIDSNSTSGSPSGDELPNSISDAAPSSSDLESRGDAPDSPTIPRRLLSQEPGLERTTSSSSSLSDSRQHRITSILNSNPQMPLSSMDENRFNQTTPSRVSRPTEGVMKAPGSFIETPNIRRTNLPMPISLQPHPLRTLAESPQPELMRHVALSQSVSESQDGNQDDDEDDEDDEAFLPDDFCQPQAETSYTWEQVQEYVREAEANLKDFLENRHQHAMDELQSAMEKQLQEHGTQWKIDSEEEFERLESMVREEKTKTQQKHRELIHKATQMAELENQLAISTEHKRNLEARVQALEQQMEEEMTANDQAKELYLSQLHQQIQELQAEVANNAKQPPMDMDLVRSLREEKKTADMKIEELERLVLQSQNQVKSLEMNQSMSMDGHNLELLQANHEHEVSGLKSTIEEANMQISELQAQVNDYRSQVDSSQMEEVILIRSQKAAAERKVKELQELLDMRRNKNEERSRQEATQLRDANSKIGALQQELEEAKSNLTNASFCSEVSHEELFAAKSEAETLRALREEDLKEKSEMQVRLRKMQQELMLSPRKKGKDQKVEIDTLTVELLESTSKEDETIMALRRELEVLRSERSILERRVEYLENEAGNLETANSDGLTREDLELQVQKLTEEIAHLKQELEKEKSSVQSDLSVQEIQELTQEVEELKKKHTIELGQQRQTLMDDHDQALAEAEERLESLQKGFETEMVLLVETHAKEKKALKAQIAELKEQFENERQAIHAKSKEDSQAEIERLQEKLEQLRIEFEDEKIEIIRTSSRQADELQTKLSLQQETYDEEIERKESEIKDLEGRLEKLQRDIVTKEESFAAGQKDMEDMKNRHSEELQLAKSHSAEELEALRTLQNDTKAENASLTYKIASLEAELAETMSRHQEEIEEATRKTRAKADEELKALEASMKNGDNALANQLSELKAKSESDKADYNRRIREIREEHNREIDDMLKQLDLVEAEHNEKFDAKQAVVNEKEAVIKAMSAEIVEAEQRLEAACQSRDNATTQVSTLKERLLEAESALERKAKEIQNLNAEHALVLKQEEVLREKMCEEAREEMIQRAEVQFEQANGMYKKLKHEFDGAQASNLQLEKELKAVKKQLVEARKELEARELELAEELTQAKAAVATSDLNATRKMKQYRTDLDKAKETETHLKEQLEQAEATSRSVQRTLASVVDEKEKLIKENKDLKAVCEELMEIVEANESSNSK